MSTLVGSAAAHVPPSRPWHHAGNGEPTREDGVDMEVKAVCMKNDSEKGS